MGVQINLLTGQIVALTGSSSSGGVTQSIDGVIIHGSLIDGTALTFVKTGNNITMGFDQINFTGDGTNEIDATFTYPDGCVPLFPDSGSIFPVFVGDGSTTRIGYLAITGGGLSIFSDTTSGVFPNDIECNISSTFIAYVSQ